MRGGLRLAAALVVALVAAGVSCRTNPPAGDDGVDGCSASVCNASCAEDGGRVGVCTDAGCECIPSPGGGPDGGDVPARDDGAVADEAADGDWVPDGGESGEDGDANADCVRGPPPVPDGGVGMPCGPNCRQITFGVTVEMNFHVWGDWVAYTEASTRDSSRVAAVNLVTGEQVEIASTACAPDLHYGQGGLYVDSVLAASMHLLAPDASRAECRMYLGPVTGGSLREINHTVEVAPDDLCVLGSSALWGDWVAYTDDMGSGCPVYVLNHVTGEKRTLPNPWHCHTDVALWGDDLVYGDIGTGRSRLWHYRISTEEAREVTDTPRDQYSPAVWNGLMVCADARNELGPSGGYWIRENPDIYLQPLDGRPGYMVEDEGSIQRNPDIYGDWVVWEDERNDPTPNGDGDLPPGGPRWDVYAHNLATGETRWLTRDSPVGGGEPKIWGNRVVFREWDGGAFFEGKVSLFVIDLE